MRPEELGLRTRLQPLKPPQTAAGPPAKGATAVRKGSPFSEVLADKLATRSETTGAAQSSSGVAFSAHARARLKERNVELSPLSLQRLNNGVRLAESKGSENTLVLMDDTAFIVSVRNRKVITAITKDAAVDNVFTKIDSATIV